MLMKEVVIGNKQWSQPTKDFGIAAPEATNTSSYHWLNSIPQEQRQKMTAAQKEIADYWTANPAFLERNSPGSGSQIQFAPAPNADGIYNLPDVNNPASLSKISFLHIHLIPAECLPTCK